MTRIYKPHKLLFVLVAVLIAINTNAFWRMVYPIPYKETIWEVAEIYDQDPRLIASIIMVESQYRKKSVSGKGAIGLMQLMPKTAAWAADINGIAYTYEEELAKPEINIRLGTWYVSYLQKKYKGNLPLMLAGYNSGPARLDEWLLEDRWNGEMDTINQVPFGETRHYIQRVQHFFGQYQKIYPNSDGVKIPPESSLTLQLAGAGDFMVNGMFSQAGFSGSLSK